jgi:hypothetical protein
VAPSSGRPQSSLWRELKRNPLFGLGLVLALMGSVFVLHFGSQGLLHWRLAQSGVTVTATVEEVSRRQSGPAARPSLALVYRDAAGQRQSVHRVLRSSAYRVGEEVTVIHDPFWPSLLLLKSELGSPREVRELVIMGGIGLLAAGFGWPLLLRRWRRARLTVALVRHGRHCTGEILEMRPCAYKTGNHQPSYCRYTFRGPDGRRREGNSDPLSADLSAGMQRGDRLTVLCDRRHPDRHLPLFEYS